MFFVVLLFAEPNFELLIQLSFFRPPPWDIGNVPTMSTSGKPSKFQLKGNTADWLWTHFIDIGQTLTESSWNHRWVSDCVANKHQYKRRVSRIVICVDELRFDIYYIGYYFLGASAVLPWMSLWQRFAFRGLEMIVLTVKHCPVDIRCYSFGTARLPPRHEKGWK